MVALVKCPDCKQEVSLNADACPHCGCKLTKERKQEAVQQLEVQKLKSFIGCLTFIAIMAISYFLISSIFDNSSRDAKRAIVGNCDICGRPSTVTTGAIDLCSTHFESFMSFDPKKDK